MDSTSLEDSPNAAENSQVRRSTTPDPTKNLNNHFESVANQKYDSISEINKRGSMPSILHNSHLDHEDIFVGEDEDFVFEVESPKLSNKMQMILQSNVNLSESIIQNTFKAVDASRIKLEDRDLQVELEITELKLHHLEKKLEGCLQSSKSTLSMNAKLSENVSKILHSPSKRAQTMNLPEIKPRSSVSPKTLNENGSQFFRSAQGISSSSPQTSNRLPPSGKKQQQQVQEEAPNDANVNVYERHQQSQSQLQAQPQEIRTITGTSIENKLNSNSNEITPNLETYLDNLKNSPYYFTFNQNQAKIAEELAKNMSSSNVLQASIVDEAELLQNARNNSETKKMALPGLNFNILPHNAQNQQELPPPYKAPPENNNYINTQDNVSLDYSEITHTNIQPPSESRNIIQPQSQGIFSQIVSQNPYGKQEIVLEDANKNQIVYILKPKETLSFQKLETINIFFQAPAQKIIDHSEYINKQISLNIPPHGKSHPIPGVESEVESLLTTENIITQSSPAKVKLSVIRESETGHNTSYSESQPAAVTENEHQQQQLEENAQAMHLKLQLLNHPRCQKLLYGDDQYTVSNRGCSILQNRLESLDSGKKILTNRSDTYFKQKVHDFKNFLKEFEELLGSETIIPQLTQGSQPNSPQQPIKRLNSCDSERLNSGEAKILENILEKYFSSPQKQAQQDDSPAEQQQQEEQQLGQQEIIPIQPAKEKKLKKKRSVDKKPKGSSKQPKVILNTSNLSNMTIKENSAAQSPAQKFHVQSPLDKILSGSSTLTFKHIDMIANPIKLNGVSSVKSDSNIQFESTMKDTRKNSEVSTHIAETEVRSPTGGLVDYAQFSKLAKNPRSVSFASGKSSSMKTLPEAQQEVKLAKSKATASKSKISMKSSPKKSTSKPRSSSKTNKKAASTSNGIDVLSLLKPTGKKAKF